MPQFSYESPLGTLYLRCEGAVVTRLSFEADMTGDSVAALNRDLASVLDEYFAGDFGALGRIEARGEGTLFQMRVWSQLKKIPPGETRSYGEMAKELQSHARAVGSANRSNPVAILVPCHRVIASTGALHGYAGGLARKAWLLAHEGAYLGDCATAKPRSIRPRARV